MVARPLVSVIVPVHNGGALLARAMDSVIEQTYTEIELIVVDDGSTDDSAATAESFRARYPHRVTVVPTPHRGRADARNAGVGAATGELIGFVDADDVACPELYERLVEPFLGSPDVDVTVCRYQNVDVNGQRGHIYEEGQGRTFGGPLSVHPEMLTELEASLCNKLFRRSLFSDAVRFPSGRDFEDLATTYRLLACAHRIERIDSVPLYLYQQGGPESVMAACDDRYLDLIYAIETNCVFFADAAQVVDIGRHLLRFALRHLVSARLGDLFMYGRPSVVSRYIDGLYELLDRRFPDWRTSQAFRETFRSPVSRLLVRRRPLLRAYALLLSRSSGAASAYGAHRDLT